MSLIDPDKKVEKKIYERKLISGLLKFYNSATFLKPHLGHFHFEVKALYRKNGIKRNWMVKMKRSN